MPLDDVMPYTAHILDEVCQWIKSRDDGRGKWEDDGASAVLHSLLRTDRWAHPDSRNEMRQLYPDPIYVAGDVRLFPLIPSGNPVYTG